MAPAEPLRLAFLAFEMRRPHDDRRCHERTVTAAEAAAERDQAISTFWRDVRAGRVPSAYYVSPRCPRWRRSELRTAPEACRAPVKIVA